MHLRRICGTCAAFPEAADMRAKAQPCARREAIVNGARSAANCKLWTRKVAGAEQSKTFEVGKN